MDSPDGNLASPDLLIQTRVILDDEPRPKRPADEEVKEERRNSNEDAKVIAA